MWRRAVRSSAIGTSSSRLVEARVFPLDLLDELACAHGLHVSQTLSFRFDDLDDLYVSALRRATEEQVALFAGTEMNDLRAVARLIHRWATENRGAALAQYELMFLAMRRDALRADANSTRPRVPRKLTLEI